MNARQIVEAQSLDRILARAKAGEKFEVLFKYGGYGSGDYEAEEKAYKLAKALELSGIPNYVKTKTERKSDGPHRHEGEPPPGHMRHWTVTTGYAVMVNQENEKKKTRAAADPIHPDTILKRALTGEKFDVTIMTKSDFNEYTGKPYGEIYGDQKIRTPLRKYKIPHYRTSMRIGKGADCITTVHINQEKPGVRVKTAPQPMIKHMAKSTLGGAKKPYHIQSLDQQLPAPPVSNESA